VADKASVEAAPKLGEAVLPAPSLAHLLRRNATDPLICDRPAIRVDDRTWTHAEYYAAACRWANLLLAHETEAKPLHVAVLLDNGPEYLFAFGAAALAGGAVVGVNHTRGGEHLLHDVLHTDCVLFVHDPRHSGLTDGVLDRAPNPLALGA
jgi:fatty-acyl-CoA synthase